MAFKLCKKGNCGVTITDLNDGEYQDVSILTTSGNIYYTYLESATVNTLSSINYEGESTVQVTEINKHYKTEDGVNVLDESNLDFAVDGLYEVNHIILPTMEWYQIYQTEVLNYFDSVYVVSGDQILKLDVETREFNVVTIEELLEVNPTNTTIIKETKNTFSLCHLLECFYNICKDLLSKLCPINCRTKTEYQDLIFNRDLIWMAINVIRYCIELGQYYEAQRILEQIQGCGTICAQYDKNKLRNAGGCGCNH